MQTSIIANLGGDDSLAGEIVKRLVHIVATVSPGAKLGATAPYSYSHLVLAEFGKKQPRSLVNAFIKPVRMRGDLVQDAYRALSLHLTDLEQMYGKGDERAHAGLQTGDLFENKMSLEALSDWVKNKVLA